VRNLLNQSHKRTLDVVAVVVVLLLLLFIGLVTHIRTVYIVSGLGAPVVRNNKFNKPSRPVPSSYIVCAGVCVYVCVCVCVSACMCGCVWVCVLYTFVFGDKSAEWRTTPAILLSFRVQRANGGFFFIHIYIHTYK